MPRGNGHDDDSDDDLAFGISRTIVFQRPVKVGGTTYEEITLSEPTAGAVRDAQRELGNGPLGTQSVAQVGSYRIAIVAASARVNRAVVERMPHSQVIEAFDFIAPLLDGGRETSETSSPTSPDTGDGDRMTGGP